MSGLFNSSEILRARNEIGTNRTKEATNEMCSSLYKMLSNDINKAKKKKGRDYITYTLDRKIGKTYSLMKLAWEYQYPLIVHDASWARHLEVEARKDGKHIQILSYRSIPSRLDGTKCDIILKDEIVAMEELRDMLNDNGLGYVNVVGVN